MCYRPKRYECQECEGKPTTIEQMDWRDKNSTHTVSYDDHLLLQLVNGTVEGVSLKERIAYD